MNSYGKVDIYIHKWRGIDGLTNLYAGDGWFEGANNQYPTDTDSVSSFDGIDAAIAFFADKNKFPMLQHIVLAGHSAGGQSTQGRLIRIPCA